MSEPKRPIAVLVDREGMGDVMLKTPFLRALRRAFPDHDVWWIATHQTSMADELRPMFGREVARVISHAALDGAAGPLMKRLAAFPPFERVFDSRTKVSTVALARLGLTHNGFYCCLPGYILCDGRMPRRRRRPRHIAARMLSLIECATGRIAEASGRLEASAAARALAHLRLPEATTYVGIAPGSRQADKNWPLDRFCAVAQALLERGLTPVFLLGPLEADIDERIAKAVPAAVRLNAGPDSPPGAALDLLIAESQRLSALIANDNGVGHLLGAAGVPVVSLFGPTNPARWAPVAPANAIVRAQSFGGGQAMDAIPVEAVVEAVTTLLARSSFVGQSPPAM